MERIKMVTTSAGPAGTFNSGSEYAVPEQIPIDLAEQLLGAGAATLVAVRKPDEKATAGPEEAGIAPEPEKAVSKAKRIGGAA